MKNIKNNNLKMKFIEIKAIITILIIALTASSAVSKRRSRNTVSTQEFLQSLIKAELSPNSGGDWVNGFACPSIMIRDNKSGRFVNQGKAVIQGKSFVEGAGANAYGLVLDFGQQLNQKSYIAQVSVSLQGSTRIYIPWRYFNQRDFKFINPYFNNKYIEGTITNDLGNSYTLKINFPYGLIKTYISDIEGRKIKNRINRTGQFISQKIVDAKGEVRRLFPIYKVTYETIEHIKKGQQAINARISTSQAQMDVIKRKNEEAQREIDNLSVQHSKLYATFKDAKAQLDKLQKDIAEANVSMKSYSDAITTLENSKNDPQMQASAVAKEKKKSLDAANKEYSKLMAYASDRMNTITKSKVAFVTGNTAQYKMNMEAFVPKY